MTQNPPCLPFNENNSTTTQRKYNLSVESSSQISTVNSKKINKVAADSSCVNFVEDILIEAFGGWLRIVHPLCHACPAGQHNNF